MNVSRTLLVAGTLMLGACSSSPTSASADAPRFNGHGFGSGNVAGGVSDPSYDGQTLGSGHIAAADTGSAAAVGDDAGEGLRGGSFGPGH